MCVCVCVCVCVFVFNTVYIGMYSIKFCVYSTICSSILNVKCGNLAREGLRILVVGKKDLTEEEYVEFEVSGEETPPTQKWSVSPFTCGPCVCTS